MMTQSGSLYKLVLGLLATALAVQAQSEIEECKAWVSTLNTTTAGSSGNKTEVTQYFDNCDDFEAHEMQKNPSVVQHNAMEVNLGSRRTSPPVPMDFLGFAFEYNGLDSLVPNGKPNKAVINMFKNLQEHGHTMVMLIGGNSAMHARLAKSKLPVLPESNLVMSDSDFKDLERLAKQTGAELTLGLPMLVQNTSYAVEFAVDGILKNINTKYLRSLEFGNEPDHWQMLKKCYRKDPNFGFSSFMSEYNELSDDLTAAWPKNKDPVPYQGPAIAGCNTFPVGQLPCWQSDLPKFAAATGPRTEYVSYHRYGNSGCSKMSNLRTLMNDPIPGDQTKSYDWLDRVITEMEPGTKVLWSEGNAFSCGGNKCLSHTYAVTLWALDNMFEVALRGADGAYIHAVPNHIYTPFTPIGASKVEVLPVYYATLAFSDLFDSPDSKVFLPLTSFDSPLIKVWGIEQGNTTKYCFIHKDPDQTSPLEVSINAPNVKKAELTWLRADSPFSTEINYIGQSVGSNGKLQGGKHVTTFFSIDGKFIFEVNPMSITFIKFL